MPAVAGLKKQGASNGAAVSFLISTPETGVDSIALTYSLLDPIMTVMRPVTAFVTALCAGVVENITGKESATTPQAPYPQNTETPGPQTRLVQLWDGQKFAFNDLMNDIAVWFVIGVALAGIITALVPESFVSAYLGAGVVAYLAMLAMGLPLYVCASMSTPLAAALVMKGLSPGAALVFLMTGPATNAATMIMVMGIFGRRTLVVYLASIVLCSLTFGLLTDALYAALGTSAKATASAAAAEVFPEWLEWTAAGLLALLVMRSLWRTYITGQIENEAPKAVQPVSGCCSADQPAGCT